MQEATFMSPKNKLNAVEGIRGVACLMVILSHLALTFFPYIHITDITKKSSYPVQSFIFDSPFSFIFSGTSAIFIFFVLSGYILTYVALGKNNFEFKILEMSIKRYPRLVIPTIISCLAALITFYLFNFDTSELSYWIGMYGNFDYSLIGAIYSGAVRSFFVGESLYNPVLWTMKIELLGSFIIFLICYFKTKKNKVVESSILLVGIVFLFTGANGSKTSLGVVSFLIGYLFYLHGREISWITSTSLFVVGLYLAGIHMESSSYSFVVYLFSGEDEAYKVCNFLSGSMIVYPVIFNSSLNGLFSNKIFIFMGKISFSAYLVHMPVISTVGVYSFNVLHSLSLAFHDAALLAALISIFATCLVSMVYYKGVDRMGMRAASRFSKKVLASLRLGQTYSED